MYYSDDVLEQVRSGNDIVDVVSSYVKLKRKGSSWFGLCPFHSEKTGSFSVNPSRQTYHCFGCGAGGNVISFIMQYENYSFQEAVQYLAKRAGISLPERQATPEEKREQSRKNTLLDMHKAAAIHYYRLLYSEEGRYGYQYFRGRGLTDETIRRFGLGYSSRKPGELYRFLKQQGFQDSLLKESGLVTIEERGARDKFWNRVMFPILDLNSRVIGFGGRVLGDGEPKYLNSPETPLFDKSRNLYGLNYAKSSRKPYFLLCEGYMDVISLHQAGFTNAVASLGTALTPQHCLLLKRYVKEVILTYDSDGAGVKAARRAIPLLRGAGITPRVLSMKPCKDPDEFIKKLGAEAYEERINGARNAFLWEADEEAKGFRMEDPAEKTAWYRRLAEMLTVFTEPLERENYLKAVCREHGIPEEELRSLVNRTGAARGYSSAADYNRYEGSGAEERGPARKPGKKPEDALLKSQRLCLTLLSEDPALYLRTRKWIGAEDFPDEFYRELAERLFPAFESGNFQPAAILDLYADEPERLKKAAEVLHGEDASRPGSFRGDEERLRALTDCVRRLKAEALDRKAGEADLSDTGILQQLLREKSALQKLKL